MDSGRSGSTEPGCRTGDRRGNKTGRKSGETLRASTARRVRRRARSADGAAITCPGVHRGASGGVDREILDGTGLTESATGSGERHRDRANRISRNALSTRSRRRTGRGAPGASHAILRTEVALLLRRV